MSCRVFLVGEGPDDIGDLFDLRSYRRGIEGFLQPLLRNMVGPTIELEFFDGRRLTALPKLSRRRDQGLESGLQTRKAAQALALAVEFKADALVFSCDLDKTGGQPVTATERRHRLRTLRASVEAGFARVRKGDPDAENILTAIAIPARMIEAWALADRRALADLLEVDQRTLQYPSPEEMWGDQSMPTSHHPKRVWRTVTEGYVSFAEIGALVKPATLQLECPDSFAPFSEDVARQVARCSAGRERTAAPLQRWRR